MKNVAYLVKEKTFQIEFLKKKVSVGQYCAFCNDCGLYTAVLVQLVE